LCVDLLRPAKEGWKSGDLIPTRIREARATCKSDRQLQCGNATLAFGLAIHLAFRNNLAIVGLSLDDDFLKKQIEHGRDQMEKVLLPTATFRVLFALVEGTRRRHGSTP